MFKERRARKRIIALRDNAQKEVIPYEEFPSTVYRMMSLDVPDWFTDQFVEIVGGIYELEQLNAPFDEPPAISDSVEGYRYLSLLERIGNRSHYLRMAVVLSEVCDKVVNSFPPAGPFNISFFRLFQERDIVDTLKGFFYTKASHDFFPNIRRIINENTLDAKLLENPWNELKRTPLINLHWIKVPFGPPFELYFEHTHILGGSGAGKTSYLAQLTLEHIRRKERPAIVIVDSQDSLIPNVRRLAQIQGRITYIDPLHPPTINLFDGGTFDTYKYLFSSILDMELTGKQETFFKFVVRLLQEVPEATIHDLVQVTVSLDKYRKYIDRLPSAHQQFFHDDYPMTYRDTRSQVRTRLQGILADETLSKLLSGKATELDIEGVLSRGGVLLVDTSKDALGGASDAFGKVFIFLIMKALYGRKDRHPVFLLIDEAFQYFSSTIDDMLNQMRKFRCGCVFAHQNLGQATPELRASLASSTSIKLASQVSVPDAKVMAGEMHTTPEFITEQPRLHFALFARGVTKQAVSIAITPGVLVKENMVDVPRPAEHPAERPTPKVVTPEVPRDEIDTDISDQW